MSNKRDFYIPRIEESNEEVEGALLKAKKHGFFARKESNILNSRRKKGRKKIVVK